MRAKYCAVTSKPAIRWTALTLLAVAAVVLVFIAKPSSNQTANPLVTKGETRRLRVLTYNVLDDEASVPQRAPALFKILKECDADIIALQELTPELVTRLGKEDWIRQSYRMRSEEGQNLVFEELCILSKFPIQHLEFRRLPGHMHRGVLVATISAFGRTLAVATSHLDSFLEDGEIRAEQLDYIFSMLKDADDAVFMGDFNFGDGEEPDTAHLDKHYTDLWHAVNKDAPGYTWNIEKSEMAKKGSFPTEKSRRIDRILLRSNYWLAESSTIVGDSPISADKPDLYPSDHFGLTATMKSK